MSNAYATTLSATTGALVGMIERGHDGGTVWTTRPRGPRTRREDIPTRGYVVGGVIGEYVLPSSATHADIESRARTMFAHAAVEGRRIDGIGFWTHPDGHIVLDIVQWVGNMRDAIAAGNRRDEHSIYDIAADECLIVRDYAHNLLITD